MGRIWLVVVFICSLSAAFGQTFGPDPSRVDWGTIDAGQNCNIATKSFTEIPGPDQLEAHYRKLTGMSVPARFKVEWTRYKVIALTSGPKPVGTALFVRAVDRQVDGTTVITAVERGPVLNPNARVAQQSAYSLIRVERSAHNIRVNWTQLYSPNGVAGQVDDFTSWFAPNAPRYGYVSLSYGSQCNISERGFSVANNQDEYEALLQRMFGAGSRTPVHQIDWSRYKIIAIALGERPTGGYSLSVDTIARAKTGETYIVARETAPGFGRPAAQMITRQFVILRVDNSATNLALKFITSL
jgi:hypothetical protein